jgi:IclR family transcriptional regulator, KDG regulon repressor
MPAQTGRQRRGCGAQGVQSVEIAARILGCFTVNEPVLGVTQLGDRLNMPKSKVHRFLVSLQRSGLVRRDPTTDRYSLGLKLYELGQVAVGGLDVLTHAGNVARRLAHETGQTASAAIWTNEGPVLSHVSTPPGRLGVGYAVGSVVSLHASAHGKVFLAFQPSEEEVIFGTLRQFTRHTVTDPQVLVAQLDLIRHDRIAVSRNESALGLFEVSSPVFGIDGRIAASIGLVGLSDEVSAQRERELREIVGTTAADLSRELGYEPQPAPAGAVTPAAGALVAANDKRRRTVRSTSRRAVL